MIYLFVSHSAQLHGAEISLVELTRILRATEACTVHVVLPIDGGQEAMAHQLRAQGCTVHRLPYRHTHWVGMRFARWRFIREHLALIPRLLTLYRQVRPDVIILNTVVVSPVFALLGALRRIPRIWYIRELGAEVPGYRFLFGRRWSTRVIRALATHLVFNSRFTRRAYLSGREAGSSVIPPAIDAAALRPRSPHAPRAGAEAPWSLVVVGRTAEGKGQFDAVRALDLLVHHWHRPDVHLTIIGVLPNAYTTALRAFTERAGLERHITWVPYADPAEVRDQIRRADIGLVTSRQEAFGRVTVEYLLAGLITVGADEGGTAEILDQFRETTFRYVPGDHAGLAQCLDTVMRTPRAAYQSRLDAQVRLAQATFADARQADLWRQVIGAVTIPS